MFVLDLENNELTEYKSSESSALAARWSCLERAQGLLDAGGMGAAAASLRGVGLRPAVGSGCGWQETGTATPALPPSETFHAGGSTR